MTPGSPTIGTVIAVAVLALLLLPATHAMTLTVGQRESDVTGTDNTVLQAAVDAVAHNGGGTVYVKSGTYTMYDSLFLRTGVNVVGVGPAPVLQKAPSYATPLTEDAGYGLDRVVVQDASGLKKGMGLAFSDDAHKTGWYVNVRSITEVDGNTVSLDEGLDLDYLVARNGKVETVYPVICGKQVKAVKLENLVADGNRGSNALLNGCRGGAIYFWKSEHCVIDGCTARNYSGDGISYQVSPYVTVTRCRTYRNADLGVHPGSGSHHTEVTNCQITDNGGSGLFLCWRVKQSRFVNNLITGNSRDGVSIGHQDTDNVFVGNTIQRNGRHGVHFRPESEANGGHRNTLQDNIIRDNGQEQAADGIRLEASVHDITIVGNTIEDTGRDGRATQQNGISLGPGVDGVTTRGNVISGHPGDGIVDKSGGTHNSLQS